MTPKLKKQPFVYSDLNSLAPLSQTKILAYDKNSFFLTLIRQGEKMRNKILAYNKILYLTLIRQGEIFTFHSINYFFINRKRALRPLTRSTFFSAKKVLKKSNKGANEVDYYAPYFKIIPRLDTKNGIILICRF